MASTRPGDRLRFSTNGRQHSYDAVDALVIGAGITGMYKTLLLREAGFDVRGVEEAPDVSGTWYWNRYPGCSLDTESYAYCSFALIGLMLYRLWSERFAAQPELLRCARTAADRMGIRERYRFRRPRADCALRRNRERLAAGLERRRDDRGPLPAVRRRPIVGDAPARHLEYAKTPLADSDAWWVKTSAGPDGPHRRALIYVGAAPEYRSLCNEVARNDYEGFNFH